MFYAVAYIGFGLPLLLTVAGPSAGSTITLTGMAVGATAAYRGPRLREDTHRRH